MRHIEPFDPWTMLADDFPGWAVEFARTSFPEQIFTRRKRMVLQLLPAGPARRLALAHGLAHLRLGHHETAGRLTDQQERDADFLADLWLDDPSVWAETLP